MLIFRGFALRRFVLLHTNRSRSLIPYRWTPAACARRVQRSCLALKSLPEALGPAFCFLNPTVGVLSCGIVSADFGNALDQQFLGRIPALPVDTAQFVRSKVCHNKISDRIGHEARTA